MRRITLLAMAARHRVGASRGGGRREGDTRVTIDSAFSTPTGTYWAGDIFSRRKACKNERLVLVFRARPGADQKVGQTRSFKGMVDNNYYWTMNKPGIYPSGNYYAKVNPNARCKGDRSGLLASDL